MLTAVALALSQLADPRVLRVLGKSLVITLAVFAVLGTLGWWGINAALAGMGAGMGAGDTLFVEAGGPRGLAALVAVIAGGWLLWRIIALAVLQFFADEVVAAVEARHYPAAHAAARSLGWRAELTGGLHSGGRAMLYNLLALPVALVLLVTGVGAPLVFLLVNAILLGRELTELVWLRHRPAGDTGLPLKRGERLVLGGMVAALLTVPFVNLLAPILGAATAAHLVHRKGVRPHAA